MFKPAKTVEDRVKAMQRDELIKFLEYIQHLYMGDVCTLLDEPAVMLDGITQVTSDFLEFGGK